MLSQRRAALVGRLKRRRTREREGAVLVEGVRGVGAALDASATLRFALYSERLDAVRGGRPLRERLEGAAVDLVRVDEGRLDELADTQQNQGVLAVCGQPDVDGAVVRPGGRYLVLDAVQDPGNVGTLVRSAAAFSLDAVMALDGTVDPWGSKAVRASAGAVFLVPLLNVRASDALAALREAGVPLLVAEAGGEGVRGGRTGPAWALVVGNEGAGPRDEVRASATECVSVPMRGKVESLNAGVAGSLLIYELTREVPGV